MKTRPAIFLLVSFLALRAMAADSATESSRIVRQYKTVFTKPPRNLPSRGPTDAPLMGNGDFLAALGGPPEMLQFHLCKADLWELRPDGGPRGLGRLDLALASMKGAKYSVTQDLLGATTNG